MALHWYLARTRPRGEHTAAAALQRAGFELLFPCVQTLRTRRGHDKEPLFPGYIFVRYDVASQGWPSLYNVARMAGWVRFGGVAHPVLDDVVDQIAQRTEAVDRSGGLRRLSRPGERVRVALGPVESVGEVLEEPKSPRARVQLLLEFLGRLVEAQVPWRQVSPVGAQGPIKNWNGPSPRRTRGRGRWIQGYGPRV